MKKGKQSFKKVFLFDNFDLTFKEIRNLLGENNNNLHSDVQYKEIVQVNGDVSASYRIKELENQLHYKNQEFLDFEKSIYN